MNRILKIFFLLNIILAPMERISAEPLADSNSKVQFKVRMGYSIGGTAPIGLPATIRHIDSYSLGPSALIGVDIQKSLCGKWGILTGVRFENKAFEVDATTKAYHMEVRRGDSELEGLFTGKVHQEVTQVMFTFPIYATYTFNPKLQLKAGPYFSVVCSKDFSGIASDGYIRQGNPTGPKIDIGATETEWATYDFSDDMRTFQMGIAAGIDWSFYRNWGLSADLNWGLNGIFPRSFKTIEDTLYPIYGTIGFYYHLK